MKIEKMVGWGSNEIYSGIIPVGLFIVTVTTGDDEKGKEGKERKARGRNCNGWIFQETDETSSRSELGSMIEKRKEARGKSNEGDQMIEVGIKPLAVVRSYRSRMESYLVRNGITN